MFFTTSDFNVLYAVWRTSIRNNLHVVGVLKQPISPMVTIDIANRMKSEQIWIILTRTPPPPPLITMLFVPLNTVIRFPFIQLPKVDNCNTWSIHWTQSASVILAGSHNGDNGLTWYQTMFRYFRFDFLHVCLMCFPHAEFLDCHDIKDSMHEFKIKRLSGSELRGLERFRQQFFQQCFDSQQTLLHKKLSWIASTNLHSLPYPSLIEVGIGYNSFGR